MAVLMPTGHAVAIPHGILDSVRTLTANIAAELGSAREVISRLLKEFERQGAVSLGRGRITLTDAATLRGLAADAADAPETAEHAAQLLGSALDDIEGGRGSSQP